MEQDRAGEIETDSMKDQWKGNTLKLLVKANNTPGLLTDKEGEIIRAYLSKKYHRQLNGCLGFNRL